LVRSEAGRTVAEAIRRGEPQAQSIALSIGDVYAELLYQPGGPRFVREASVLMRAKDELRRLFGKER
jgi:hypothetical protein